MATRSYISKLLPDGSVRGIYCHFDGYPDGVGAILKEHYTDSDKVDELLELGSISSLGPEIGEAHDYGNPTKGFVVAYHRDRGEDLEPNTVYSTVRDMLREAPGELGAEFAYVFEAGAWQVHKL